MTDHPHVQKIVQWYLNVDSQCHERLNEIFAEDFSFEDPFCKTNQWSVLTKYYSGMFKKYKNPRFEFHDVIYEKGTAVITWTFRCSKMGMKQEIHGSWLLRLNSIGLITFHKDYWDFSEQVLEKIPVIGLLVRLLSLLIKKS